MNKHIAAVGICALALGWSAAADAQTAPSPAPVSTAARPDNGGITDIIVTAQRRSESLQKTSLSISVVKPEAIANAGVTSAAQLTSLLPTVQVGSSGPSTSVYIRGVGGFQTTSASSPAVPYYVDGVYVARTQSLTSEFYDIDRLEVLKGPQGTLYGRNASGGAINFLTVRPELGRTTGKLEVELGNYGNQTGEAAINLPIGTTMAIRASGTIVDKSGYTSERLGDDVHYAGRLKFLWQPSSDVSLLLNGSYGHIGGKTAAVVALNKDIPGWFPWLDISDPKSQAYLVSHDLAPPPFVIPTNAADARQKSDFYNISAQLDWKLAPNTTLTVMPAFRDSTTRDTVLIGFFVDNGYGLGSLPARPERSKASSLEVRLAGNSDRLKWLLGAYYFNEDQFQQYTVNGGFIQHPGVISNFGTRSYALFSQNTFSLSQSVRIIAGARYTIDKRRIFDGQTYLISPTFILGPPPAAATPCLFPFPTQPQCLVDTYEGRKTFKNFSWKFGFEADVLQNSLFYATVSKGFKAGGFNTQSALGSPPVGNAPGKAALYNPELLTSYDVGLKSRFFNNHVQLNLTGFYWDYKNHQEPVLTFTNVPGVTNLIYNNAGKAEIYGGSVDLVARLWRGGTINSTVEYAHSRYKDYIVPIPSFAYNIAAPGTFNPAFTGSGCRFDAATSNVVTTSLDCSGFEVARTPKWSGAVGITQEVPVGEGRLIANGNMNFASSRWLSVDFVPVERAPTYTKFDASLTYRAPHNSWFVTGFVRNITNEAVYTTGGLHPFGALAYGYIQPPRTYGARFGVNF